jgi:hypothetical protein
MPETIKKFSSSDDLAHLAYLKDSLDLADPAEKRGRGASIRPPRAGQLIGLPQTEAGTLAGAARHVASTVFSTSMPRRLLAAAFGRQDDSPAHFPDAGSAQERGARQVAGLDLARSQTSIRAGRPAPESMMIPDSQPGRSVRAYVRALKKHRIDPELAEKMGEREATLRALHKARRRILAYELSGPQWQPRASPMSGANRGFRSVLNVGYSLAQLGGAPLAAAMLPAAAAGTAPGSTVNQAQLALHVGEMTGSGRFLHKSEPAHTPWPIATTMRTDVAWGPTSDPPVIEELTDAEYDTYWKLGNPGTHRPPFKVTFVVSDQLAKEKGLNPRDPKFQIAIKKEYGNHETLAENLDNALPGPETQFEFSFGYPEYTVTGGKNVSAKDAASQIRGVKLGFARHVTQGNGRQPGQFEIAGNHLYVIVVPPGPMHELNLAGFATQGGSVAVVAAGDAEEFQQTVRHEVGHLLYAEHELADDPPWGWLFGRSDMYPSAEMGYFPSNKYSEANIQEMRRRNNYYPISVTRKNKGEL